MSRFWRALPPRGKLGILFGSWYTAPILHRVLEDGPTAELDQDIGRIERFERMLGDEGVALVKFWFHLSKRDQKHRLQALEAKSRTRWRVTKEDWRRYKMYDTFRSVSEHTLRKTSTANAPWTVIEGLDPCYRSLSAGRQLLQVLRHRLDAPQFTARRIAAAPVIPATDHRNVLDALDLSKGMGKDNYLEKLEKEQGRLNLLARSARFRDHAVLAVFEGMDAAGKGGAIRRVTQALDARHYSVIPFAAPTDDERRQPYLWRFWRHLPRRGNFTLYDRSWYGRVLVERVEGFCAEADWLRAYSEIIDFEEQLVRHGVVVVKFWLQIDKAEQMRRFKERQSIEYKRHKITAEDWRNRKKWAAYQQAAADMIECTSTELAPWTMVEANDKHHARIKILRSLSNAIEKVG